MAEAKARFTLSARDQTRRVFGKVRSGLLGLANTAKRAFSFGGRVGGGLVALLGLGGGIAIVATFKKIADEIDNISKTAIRLGTNVKFLSEMKLGVEKSGIEFESFTKGLQKMQRGIGEAVQGTGEAKKVLDAFGLSARKMARLPMERQLDILADKFAAVKNETVRTTLAAQLFGDRNVKLIQMMTKGSAGLREMRDEAKFLGISFNNIDAKKITEMNDSAANFGASLLGAFKPFVLFAAAVLGPVFDWLTLKVVDMRQQGFKPMIDFALAGIDKILRKFNEWKISIDGVLERLDDLSHVAGFFTSDELANTSIGKTVGVTGRAIGNAFATADLLRKGEMAAAANSIILGNSDALSSMFGPSEKEMQASDESEMVRQLKMINEELRANREARWAVAS